METAHPGRAGLCHAPAVAIVLILLAYMVAPLMDGTAKWLSGELPVLQIVWARYFFHFLIVLPVVIWRYGAASLWPAEAGIQFLRSCFLVASTVVFFFAISMMPLADAIALVFVYPVVVTALSPLILGEHVGMRRWAAVGIGLIGTLVVVRPGGAVFGWPALLAFSDGTIFACYVLMTRRLAGTPMAVPIARKRKGGPSISPRSPGSTASDTARLRMMATNIAASVPRVRTSTGPAIIPRPMPVATWMAEPKQITDQAIAHSSGDKFRDRISDTDFSDLLAAFAGRQMEQGV